MNQQNWNIDKREPEGADRRKYKRRYIQFPVRYRLNIEGVIRDWKQSEAGNVSAGGVFVTVGEKLTVGRVMDMEFTVPGRAKPIKAKAEVKWVKVVVPDTMVECGLEFSDISSDDRAFLEKFANEEESEAD